MIVFADTSAIGSAYLGDESDGRWISDVIFDGPDPVVISELADVVSVITCSGPTVIT